MIEFNSEQSNDQMEGMCEHGNFPDSCSYCNQKENENEKVDSVFRSALQESQVFDLISVVLGQKLDHSDSHSEEQINSLIEKIHLGVQKEQDFISEQEQKINEMITNSNVAISTLMKDYNLNAKESSQIKFVGVASLLLYFAENDQLSEGMIYMTVGKGMYDEETDTSLIILQPEDMNHSFDNNDMTRITTTLIHERIHQLGHIEENADGSKKHGLSGFGSYLTHGFLEEGFVDTLSRQYTLSVLEEDDQAYEMSERKTYAEERKLISLLIKHISIEDNRKQSEGFNLLTDAHFRGDREPLKSAIEKTYGDGSFDLLATLRDDIVDQNFLETFLDNPKEAKFFTEMVLNSRKDIVKSNYLDSSVLEDLLVRWYDVVSYTSVTGRNEDIKNRKAYILKLNNSNIKPNNSISHGFSFWNDSEVQDRAARAKEYVFEEMNRIRLSSLKSKHS